MSVYLHHFGYGPHLPAWKKAWGRLRVNAHMLTVAAAEVGVDLAIDVDVDWIEIHTPGQTMPALVLHGPNTLAAGAYGWLRETVPTGRAPWDPWVCALLLRTHQLAPTACAIASDGQWGTEWLDGIGDEVSDAAPRRIVARLFGGRAFAADATDPLMSPRAVFAGPPFPSAAAS